jgi:hypothetical protein
LDGPGRTQGKAGMKEERRMDIAERLAAELTTLARKGGKTEQMGDFAAHYARLLHLLTATIKTMKELAIAQGGYLEGEAGRQARTN